jgi:UDP-N-acetylglucosamine 2-epimerase (non-hydrolysing)/GDP/UDP-N,N'-diacetylbacillosamine 2-epimerase (hydrolysing)
MQPVHRAIQSCGTLSLDLIVTGMHLLPEFASSLAEVRADRFGALHELSMRLGEDTDTAMARSIGHAVQGFADLLARLRPDIVLLQGDRGEMLAAAIAAAHMNIAIVHMSGGDRSGSIDDSVRNALSRFAHFHLTSNAASTARLVTSGEVRERVVEVGDPAIDRLRAADLLPIHELAAQFKLVPGTPFLLATLHPVTDEAETAARQMATVLEALGHLGLPTVFTYPNSDHGGLAMRSVLESWCGRPFLRIEPNLGSARYLSLMRYAAAVVGNSSSGIVECPSFGIPAVNIGSRQTGRARACNVIDVGFETDAIVSAVRRALDDCAFRAGLAACRNPYGDGRAAERTVDILRRLQLGSDLIAKWRPPGKPLLVDADGI